MDADERSAGADLRARPARLRRFGPVAALAAGTAMIVLSLTGLSGVDRRLEAMAADADRVRAPELRPATYSDTGEERRCERDDRPAGPRQRL